MSALNKLTKIQKAELEHALKSMAEGYHKTTAAKLEMEADFGRPRHGSGDCDDCEGTGYVYCDYCDEGQQEHEHWDCLEGCDIDSVQCHECEGNYRTDCSECEGEGQLGEGESDWSDPLTCQEFLMKNVPESARKAVKFIKFYRDGSVDSECTLTVPIKKAYVLVHFIEAWNKLGEAIGNGMDIANAGMHISILNDSRCYYQPGADSNSLNALYVNNFAKAMTPLLPALYFLASPSQQSRGLGFRTPRIHSSKGGVYPAICTHGCTTLEYRVFETCYDKPLMLVDFLIVIAKTLQFYKPEPTVTSLNIGELGFKEGNGLNRLYFTSKHLTALEKGLKWLKPDYKTIDQLKAERSFDVDTAKLKAEEKQRRDEWTAKFAEIKKARKARRLAVYHRELCRAYDSIAEGTDMDATAFAKERLKEALENDEFWLKGTVRQYIKQRTEDFYRNDCRYTVNV
jgi:hypothetical protein